MKKKRINLALQGGGAHGAFTWGVLEKLLEDERIEVEGISATSAGTMNALCYAYGLTTGGPEKAIEVLETFWKQVSDVGQRYNPMQLFPTPQLPQVHNLLSQMTYTVLEGWTRLFSPYQFNPFDIDPLREILSETIDFEAVRKCQKTQLYISTTHVQTGNLKVFSTPELTLDVAMASACLPFISKSVKIDEQHYWDGGYMGNPALFPFNSQMVSRDVLIVHINPLIREEVPTTAHGIMNRLNEISFNASLLKDIRAISFVQKLLEKEWIKDEYRDELKFFYLHSLRADEVMKRFSVASKFDTRWRFLNHLRKQGRREMRRWLDRHFDDIGERGTVDPRELLLDLERQVTD